MSDQDRGLYPKYRVEKLNGKPIGACFVLEESDPFAVQALLAYAAHARPLYPILADDLIKTALRWHQRQEDES